MPHQAASITTVIINVERSCHFLCLDAFGYSDTRPSSLRPELDNKKREQQQTKAARLVVDVRKIRDQIDSISSPKIAMVGQASPSPRKPRARKPKKVIESDQEQTVLAVRKNEALIRVPTFPLAAFLWPARGSASQWETLTLTLIIVGVFRWAAGLWGYSGFKKPPLFGDYEAQRHWMEVTTQLPISQWYFHDLQWWGLDYPPLTAYHSWLLGKIGSLINPSWFALFSSRGSDDPVLKIFMRATVLASEYLIYVPATVVFVRRFGRLGGVDRWSSSVALVAILMQPGLILIDHVHFQYNAVMLGFVMASMSSMLAGRFLWASVFFVAALGFKQMALYYACSVFAYLLGACVFPKFNMPRLLAIAAVTAASFAVLALPLIIGVLYDAHRGIDSRPELDGPPPPLPMFSFLSDYLDTEAVYYKIVEQMVQLIHRVFPFARGLFEDKVANFWCALNVIFKLRKYPAALLQKAALGATLAAIIPPNVVLFLRPRKAMLPPAFAATAWGFFLFSYQVHEKSVLLPLMPMTMMLAGRNGLAREVRAWVGFANMLGVWTMFPLLQRVDLRVPYVVLTLLWAYLLGLPPTSTSAYFDDEGPVTAGQWMLFVVHAVFYLCMAAWHIVDRFFVPPVSMPDLWVVANVGLGSVGFALCYLWCTCKLLLDAELIPRSWSTTKTKVKKG